MPRHADGTVSIHFGYGRRSAGRIGGDTEHIVGFDAFFLRSSEHPWFAGGLEVEPTSERYSLACTQSHFALDGRDIVRATTLADYRENPQRSNERASEA